MTKRGPTDAERALLHRQKRVIDVVIGWLIVALGAFTGGAIAELLWLWGAS